MGPGPAAGAGGYGGAISPWYARYNKLRRAIKILRTAKGAAAKEKATVNLSKLLKDQFDTDLKQREKEIASIEARVKQLRSILGKRRDARNEIIELQVKVLVNEAKGLGFPAAATRRTGRSSFPSGMGDMRGIGFGTGGQGGASYRSR